jgi:glycosyltransferase involved in cell wall biosynthesis
LRNSRVVFITSSLGREGKNFEHIIRVHFLSRQADLVIISPKGSDFSQHAETGTSVIRGRMPGKLGVIIDGICWLSRKENRQPAAVVVTEPSVVGIVGFIARVVFSMPWVVDVWDIPLRYLGTDPIKRLKNRVSRMLFRYLYCWADLFIVGIRPDMGFKYFRVPENKILAWQTTIWPPESRTVVERKHDGTFQILCMRSNHNIDMGLDVLSHAFKELEQRIDRIKLWIVGAVDADVESSIGSLRTSPKVVFTGFLKHEKLLKLIDEVDICVIPWRDVEDLAQTYPSKVMEYLTQGKVLVAPRIAGISEMVSDGNNGLLFTPGDHQELAAKIELAYRDPALRSRLSANARSYNERFDCTKKNALILARLNGLLRKSGAADSAQKIRVLFICSATPKASDRNMNYFQRAHFLSRWTDLTILARKGADYFCATGDNATIISPAWSGKRGQVARALFESLNPWGGQRYDIVITEPSILGVCGYFVSLLTGSKWVVDIWDIPIRSDKGGKTLVKIRSSLVRRLMRFLYRRAHSFIISIVPDQELDYFRIPETKKLLLMNAIWLEDRQQEEHQAGNRTQFNIFCMRSVYYPDMGLDTLCQAFLRLKDEIPGATLTIVGRIPASVSQQVRGLKEMKGIQFFDFVEHSVLMEKIRAASVCVVPFKDVPDLSQTYPIKVMEYLSLGKPVVASNITGIKKLIKDGENGLLFRAGDAEALAGKILALHKDEALRSALSRNAARNVEQFDCLVKNQSIFKTLQHLTSSPMGAGNGES